MELQQKKLQTEVEGIMEDLDRKYLRKMQAAFFRCGIRCAENDRLSTHQLQDCVERCQGPLTSANAFLQSEMENFQHRMQRCAMDCQDRLRDSLTSGNASSKQRAQEELEGCVSDCIGKHVKQLPQFKSRLQSYFADALKSASA